MTSRVSTQIFHTITKKLNEEANQFLLQKRWKTVYCYKETWCTWTYNKNKIKRIFDKASLKLAINFLLDNFFFNFGNLPILKVTGIR